VLRPGGKLVLRVPAAGPLAGFDSFNLSRYLRDVTHHGSHASETSEIGWRKHYPTADLVEMLEKVGLSTESIVRSRFVLSELLDLVILMRYRWWEFNPRAYAHFHRKVDRVRRFEDRLRFSSGFLVTVVATKLR